MASPIINFINRKVAVQDAVYWGSPRPDGTGGSKFAAPISAKVRWNEKNQLVMNDAGENVISRAELLVGEIAAVVEIGGYFLLGTLADVATAVGLPQAARRVLVVQSTPLFGSRDEFVRRVFL